MKVRELIREIECLEFIRNNTNEVCTIPEKILISREELIKSFKNLNDISKGEGLRGIEQIDTLASPVNGKYDVVTNMRSPKEPRNVVL